MRFGGAILTAAVPNGSFVKKHDTIFLYTKTDEAYLGGLPSAD